MDFKHSKKDNSDNNFNSNSTLSNPKKSKLIVISTNQCPDCNEHFKNNWSLMNHRCYEHEVTDVCKHFLRNSCKFPISVCWIKHDKAIVQKKTEENKFDCHICRRVFKTKNGMMMHKKGHI